jgi:hypothetical protein
VQLPGSASAGPSLADGKRHSSRAWQWLERELYLFGGATREREPLDGWYIDPDTGKRIADSSRKYYVAIDKTDIGALRSLLQEVCGVFKQKCIYLSIAGRVEFVKGNRDEE